MRDPFGYGGDVFIDEFYGDLDCHRGQERFAKRLKVVETGRNVCFGGKGGGGSAPSPDPNIGVAALKQAEIGQNWLDFAREQFDKGNIRQEALDELTKRITTQQIDAQDNTSRWAQADRSRYETTFRPLEDMAVLDAYGASNMSDDQLRTFLGERNAAARTQLQADFDQRAASIRALAAEKEVLNKAVQVQGGITGDNARRLAETMLQAEGTAKPSQKITKPAFRTIFGNTFGGDRIVNNPNYAQEKAAYDAKVEQLAKSLSGGGQTAQEIVRKYTDQDIETLLEAEKKKFDAEVGKIGANEEAIFAQREAQRLGQDNAAAEAKADVTRSAAQQQQAAQRSMVGMGVNPASGRFQGVSRAMDTATALASAGAQTNARRGVAAETRALRSDAINIGAGLPSSVISNYGLGLNAGNSAVGNAGAAENNWRGNVGIMGQGYGAAMQGYAGMGSTYLGLYNAQLNSWQAQQQANASDVGGLMGGIGGLLGGAANIYSSGIFSSSKKLKEDRRPAKNGLKAINSMPIEEYRYKKGVADEGEHVGPMAEDFQKATGKGDGATIAAQDAIGVTMKAVQELDQKVEKIASVMPELGRKKTEKRRAA